jgi:hypothetical protein
VKLLLVLHIVYAANLSLLLIGVLLIREAWRPVNSTLTGMTGVRIPWMSVTFVLILVFMHFGFALIAADIRKIVIGEPFTASKLVAGGLVAILAISNAFVIPIIMRVSVAGYVPLITQLSKVFKRAEANYELPDPLRLSDGTEVADSTTWMEKRRPEIQALFEDEVYGRIPGQKMAATIMPANIQPGALNGRAIRKEVILRFENEGEHLELNILIYLPAEKEGPVPAFIGLNFYGNHTIHPDPGISMSRKWIDDECAFSDPSDRKIAEGRGSRHTHWPVERIMQRGYGLITMHYYDVDPDFDDGFKNGVHPLFCRPGQSRPDPGEWGAISAWAWGLSRIMDYLETDTDVDHTRIAVMGHSRLGKTALWAGAQDDRFAAVISNNSGCMGAALSRRKYGETVADITSMFPHWFCENFKKYAGREDELPVDQHMLIALIAPRPVYVASADLDLWADPEGEFLAARAATEVYQLFGSDGLAAERQPTVHSPVMSTIGYHVRKGKHWVTDYDWDCFMDFTDMHFGLK